MSVSVAGGWHCSGAVAESLPEYKTIGITKEWHIIGEKASCSRIDKQFGGTKS